MLSSFFLQFLIPSPKYLQVSPPSILLLTSSAKIKTPRGGTGGALGAFWQTDLGIWLRRYHS